MNTRLSQHVEVARLQKENKILREALEGITTGYHSDTCDTLLFSEEGYKCTCHIGVALTALDKTKED